LGTGFRQGGVVTAVAMSESDQFRQYAEKAQLWIAQAKTEQEKQILIELMCTWTEAAVAADSLAIARAKPPQHAPAGRPPQSTAC
jgi:hypothetical protein